MRAASILGLGTALFLSSPSAFGQVSQVAREALQSLGAPTTLKAEFRQEKRLSGIDRPIVANGRLIYSSEHGVAWILVEPIRHTTVLPLGNNPGGADRALGEAATIVGSIIGGRPERLGRHFELTATRDGEGWDVRLRPLSQGLGDVFTEIIVRVEKGSATKVELRETRGDSVTIHITPGAIGEPLTPEDMGIFATKTGTR